MAKIQYWICKFFKQYEFLNLLREQLIFEYTFQAFKEHLFGARCLLKASTNPLCILQEITSLASMHWSLTLLKWKVAIVLIRWEVTMVLTEILTFVAAHTIIQDFFFFFFFDVFRYCVMRILLKNY